MIIISVVLYTTMIKMIEMIYYMEKLMNKKNYLN